MTGGNLYVYANHFSELVVYQKARDISREVFTLSRNFPSEERFSLTDQLRRSTRSIGAQLAEAWAKRRYAKHFVSKLTDADGEQLESQHWIREAVACAYLDAGVGERLIHELESIGRMLNRMIARADSFCQEDTRTLREADTTYGNFQEFFINPSGHRLPVTGH